MFRKLSTMNRVKADIVLALLLLFLLGTGVVIDFFVSSYEADKSDRSFCKIIDLTVEVPPLPTPGKPGSIQRRSYNYYLAFLELHRKFGC